MNFIFFCIIIVIRLNQLIKGVIMNRKVSDLLKEKGNVVFTISEDGKLKDIIKIFNEKHIGALVVVNERQEILGIVTERDILKKMAKTEGEIKDMSVKMIMTPRENLMVGTPGDTIEYLMKVMTVNRIRHIPIVEGEIEPKLMGLISIGDIMKAMLGDLNPEIKYLKDIVF